MTLEDEQLEPTAPPKPLPPPKQTALSQARIVSVCELYLICSDD